MFWCVVWRYFLLWLWFVRLLVKETKNCNNWLLLGKNLNWFLRKKPNDRTGAKRHHHYASSLWTEAIYYILSEPASFPYEENGGKGKSMFSSSITTATYLPPLAWAPLQLSQIDEEICSQPSRNGAAHRVTTSAPLEIQLSKELLRMQSVHMYMPPPPPSGPFRIECKSGLF